MTQHLTKTTNQPRTIEIWLKGTTEKGGAVYYVDTDKAVARDDYMLFYRAGLLVHTVGLDTVNSMADMGEVDTLGEGFVWE
jgi:hypothetical protein